MNPAPCQNLVQPNMPVMIQPAPFRPPAPPITSKAINRQAVLLGSAQIILGVLSIVFNSVLYVYEVQSAYASSGVWAGLFFIVTGPFGIAAGKRHTRGWYITYLVLSILSAVFTIGIIVQSAVGLGTENYAEYDYICPPPVPSRTTTTTRWWNDGCKWGIIGYPYRTEKIYFQASLLICGLLEAGVAIWSCILCCQAVCCGQPSNQPQVTNQTVIVNGQPMVLVSQGQPGVMYAIPVTQQGAAVMPQQQLQVVPVSAPGAAPPYTSQQDGQRTPPPTYREQASPMGDEKNLEV